MRSSLRLLLIPCLVALGAVPLYSFGRPAAAFEIESNISSCGEDVDVQFVDFGFFSWDVLEVYTNSLYSYMDDWEKADEWNGPSVVNIDRASGDVEVQWREPGHFSSDSVTAHAHSGCGDIHVNINNAPTDPVTDPWKLDMGRALTHELGHSFELEHTGQDDDDSGSDAVMSTCQSSFATSSNRDVRQDDRGALHFYHGTLNPNAMTANLSFEDDSTFWTKTSASTWSFTGGNYARWRPNSGSLFQHFYQQMRLNDTAGDDFGARLDWVRPVAGTAGAVYVAIYARQVDYGAASGSNCTWQSGLNQNNVTNVADWVLKISTSEAVAAAATTNLNVFESGDIGMTGDNVDVKIISYHTLTDTSGNPQYLRYDKFWLREK